MSAKSQLFTKKGNCAGFTADGQAVVGRYRRATLCWSVRLMPWSAARSEYVNAGSDQHSFNSASEADAFARAVIDQTETNRRKWW